MPALSTDQVEKPWFLSGTFWCYSCVCCGVGVTRPTPIHDATLKWCCARGLSTSGEEFCGELGCMSGMNKLLCLIFSVQFPPESVSVGCCDTFCHGDRPSSRAKAVSAEQVEQMQYLGGTWWLCYWGCCGNGITRCSDPLLRGQSKSCCFRAEFETADICSDEGCVSSYAKCLCCVSFAQWPPNLEMTPGCGLCNFTVMQNLPKVREPSLMAAPPVQIEMS